MSINGINLGYQMVLTSSRYLLNSTKHDGTSIYSFAETIVARARGRSKALFGKMNAIANAVSINRGSAKVCSDMPNCPE